MTGPDTTTMLGGDRAMAPPGSAFAAQPMDFVASREQSRGYLLLKRLLDVTLALLGLVLCAPLFLAIAAAIKLDSKGPVFFVHKRVGHRGEELKLYKFRSMVENAQELMGEFTPEQKREFERNYKLACDPRLTRVGSFLRKTSMDELPQLVNILQGNLSVVGPRPLVRSEIKKYGARQQRFLSVKPGLTGYWQINGRSNLTYEERMELELFYVAHASTWLDIKILFRTVWVVLQKVGAK